MTLVVQACGDTFAGARALLRRVAGQLVGGILFASAAVVSAAPVPGPPEIKAASWLLKDHHSGHVIAEQNPDLRVEPASLTKILTAYVVFAELQAGKIALDDQVLISKKAWQMPGSRMFIEVDTRVSVTDLIKGVAIQSGNDASVALAEHVAGDESAFSDLMNQYAQRLGLENSHFVNASGLPDPEHYTTARDMARLASAMIRDFPEGYKIHAQKEFVFNDITQRNRNTLLWQDPSVDGLKTGHTEAAGYCLVVSSLRDDMRLVSVIMGADSERTRARYSGALLAYGFRFFETHKLYGAASPVRDVRVWKGERESVALGLGEDLFVTVPRGQYQRLDPKMEVDAHMRAPLNKGDVRGQLLVDFDGKLIAQRPLMVLESVEEGNLWRKASDSVRLWFE